jgi:hypothetical protein
MIIAPGKRSAAWGNETQSHLSFLGLSRRRDKPKKGRYCCVIATQGDSRSSSLAPGLLSCRPSETTGTAWAKDFWLA